jgi:excinuclease ABC subunit B
LGGSGRQQSRGKSPVPGLSSKKKPGKAGAIDVQGLPRNELADLITQMNEQMLNAARELQFEVAARLRDELQELKKELRQFDAAHA